MDKSDNTKPITVLIGNKPYPLKIMSKDEYTIRRIIKQVNDKIDKFQVTYPHREHEDCMALSLLSYAIDLHTARQNPTLAAQEYIQQVADKLTGIDVLLDDLLQDD